MKEKKNSLLTVSILDPILKRSIWFCCCLAFIHACLTGHQNLETLEHTRMMLLINKPWEFTTSPKILWLHSGPVEDKISNWVKLEIEIYTNFIKSVAESLYLTGTFKKFNSEKVRGSSWKPLRWWISFTNILSNYINKHICQTIYFKSLNVGFFAVLNFQAVWNLCIYVSLYSQ